MKTMYDVQQLLKRFGVFVYIGDRIGDLEMMSAELKELYLAGLISKEELHSALMVIQQNIIEESKKGRKRSNGEMDGRN